MVRTTNIVADGLGRISSEKNSSRIADPLSECLGVRGHDLEVLRSKPVGERDAFLKIGDKDNRAKIAPASARDFFARESRQLPRDRGLDGTGEARVIGDQNRLRGGVVLGLREEIGGDPFVLIGLFNSSLAHCMSLTRRRGFVIPPGCWLP